MHWPKGDEDHLIVTASQMADLEKQILSSGLPEEALMEKVGQQMSRWLLKRNSLLNKSVIVLVGPGHNGGDGLVVARELHLAGVKVSIWCPLPLVKPLTKKQFSYASWLGVKQINHLPDVFGEELWIEAIFGLGQTKALPSEISALLKKRAKSRPGRLVSLDVPAGICSDSGHSFQPGAAKAAFTLTVGLFKSGLIQDKALPFVGDLVRVDLGFSKKVLNELTAEAPLRICSSDISDFDWPTPSRVSSKYQRGRVLVIAGSNRYPGASLLALQGALASGAGSIQAALPHVCADCFWQSTPEVVLAGCLTNSSNGSAEISDFLEKYDFNRIDSLVIGPGLGLSDEKWSQATFPLKTFKGLLVLDADAINRIANSEEGWQWIRQREGFTVITPHLKEFQRLFKDIDSSNPLNAAIEASRLTNAGVLLKGAHSVFSAPSGLTWQLGDSFPYVARTGLGDVLAGFLAGVGSIQIAVDPALIWEAIAASLLVHAESATVCQKSTKASSISSSLAKYVRKINAERYLERDI